MLELFATDLSVLQWIFFAIAGLITGVINTLAGSGSLITLPVFIFICGLPADVANGTNRIGALFQSATGVRAFQKNGETPYKRNRLDRGPHHIRGSPRSTNCGEPGRKNDELQHWRPDGIYAHCAVG